ncbi:MAG: hypothetical protein ACJZ82_04335 [Paracoccaceae bacterium]
MPTSAAAAAAAAVASAIAAFAAAASPKGFTCDSYIYPIDKSF